MSAPIIIFTKTNRVHLFDNLSVLALLQPKDRAVVIADYSPWDYFARTRSLVESQPKYKQIDLKFFKLEDNDGIGFLSMLSASHHERFICFKNYSHLRNALLEATFLTARNQNLQPTEETGESLPAPSQIYPSAIVTTSAIFWNALHYQTNIKAQDEKTARYTAAL